MNPQDAAFQQLEQIRIAQAIADAVKARARPRGPVAPLVPTATKDLGTRWEEGPTFLHRQPRRNRRTGEMEVHFLRVPSKSLAYDMNWLPRRKLENRRPTNFKGEVAR